MYLFLTNYKYTNLYLYVNHKLKLDLTNVVNELFN